MSLQRFELEQELLVPQRELPEARDSLESHVDPKQVDQNSVSRRRGPLPEVKIDDALLLPTLLQFSIILRVTYLGHV